MLRENGLPLPASCTNDRSFYKYIYIRSQKEIEGANTQSPCVSTKITADSNDFYFARGRRTEIRTATPEPEPNLRSPKVRFKNYMRVNPRTNLNGNAGHPDQIYSIKNPPGGELRSKSSNGFLVLLSKGAEQKRFTEM